MNRPDPPDQKQDLLEDTAQITELQDSRKPPKKRSTMPPDESEQPHPSTSRARRHMSEEERREARRASNRASAAKSRKRQKMTVQVLENMLFKQQQECELLRNERDAALAENQQLRLMMAEEHQISLDRNRALQRMVDQNLHVEEDPQVSQYRQQEAESRSLPCRLEPAEPASRSSSAPPSSYETIYPPDNRLFSASEGRPLV